MTTKTVRSFAELITAMRADVRVVEKSVNAAARRAANKARPVVKANVPVAFGEIRESVHADGTKVIVDAPHAAAVNNGSRPHWAPLQPLIEWVKLRGMQGLLTTRQISRLPGTSTWMHALSVADSLSAHERNGALDVDAPEKVARAIQHAIATHGTKPHHFMEKSMPEITAIFAGEVEAALRAIP